MSFSAGTRLGPYELVGFLRAGGMGEVYRAKDMRLARTVAIKVLPAHFAENFERRARFEREARAISSLNHPNICTLHDIGEQGGVDFLVMEYLEGETLAARVAKGALPLEQVLRYGVEIAGALAQAHRQGGVSSRPETGQHHPDQDRSETAGFRVAKLRTSDPMAGAANLRVMPSFA